MRFMMLMIPKGYDKAALGAMPDAKAARASRSPADVKEAAARVPEMQAKSGQRKKS